VATVVLTIASLGLSAISTFLLKSPSPTAVYTLSLHDALPIWQHGVIEFASGPKYRITNVIPDKDSELWTCEVQPASRLRSPPAVWTPSSSACTVYPKRSSRPRHGPPMRACATCVRRLREASGSG